MAYIVYKDSSSYYVFAKRIGSASAINPNRIIENQPSYVISSIKEQVHLTSTLNVDLALSITSLDGINLSNGDRVLLTGQTRGKENGIYFWDAGQELFFRSQDFFQVKSGLLVVVEEGLLYKDTLWLLTTNNPITVNVTPLSFLLVSSGSLHAPTHLYGGIDAVDGDRLGIDYIPINYVRDASGPLVTDVHDLTSHLQGIDNSLATATEDLAATLLIGNLTGGTDLVVSSGDRITAPDTIDLTLSAEDLLLGDAGDIIVKGGDTAEAAKLGGDVRLIPGLAPSGTDGHVHVEGDLEVDGKLTVAGLIDPTGIILDEAAAPTTAVNKGALFVSDGTGGLDINDLYYRPASDGASIKLTGGTEGLTPTLLIGNLTGGTDLVVSSGDRITAPDTIDLTLSAEDLLLGDAGDIIIKGGDTAEAAKLGGDVRLIPGLAPSGTDGHVHVEGDLEVDGKLTVAGLIDPTGIVLDEAAAPTTAVNKGALFVSDGTGGLDANDLYYRPQSDGVSIKLTGGTEGLAPTLLIGNLTGGTDLVVSSGDRITAPDTIDLTLSAEDLLLGDAGDVIVKGGDTAEAAKLGGDVRLIPGLAPSGTDGHVHVEGDLEVDGKLTVAGLIDPTGIILDEAAAPTTAVNKGALFVSDGTGGLTLNALYYRPGSDGTPVLVGIDQPAKIILALNEVVDGVTIQVGLGAFSFDPTQYTGSVIKFEVVLAVSNVAWTGTAKLFNVDDTEFVTSSTLSTSATTPTKLSATLTLGNGAGELKLSAKVYEVWVYNDGAVAGDQTRLGSAQIVAE